MVIVLLIPVILARSMSIHEIVNAQAIPFIVAAPVATLIFLITAIAELGRSPFDLAEAESEIVAGFHIEYTGMKFGLFYAGELLHALTMGALLSSFFLGGWRGPGVEQLPILGALWLFLKAMFIYWAIMWIKYTVPRVRIDHMLSFNWKFLTPLALVTVMVTAILDKVLGMYGLTPANGWYHAVMLAANLVLIGVTLSILRNYARLERQRVGAARPVAAPEIAGIAKS
jgi:NADH-quinone oxidoreductase subunit H